MVGAFDEIDTDQPHAHERDPELGPHQVEFDTQPQQSRVQPHKKNEITVVHAVRRSVSFDITVMSPAKEPNDVAEQIKVLLSGQIKSKWRCASTNIGRKFSLSFT